MHDNEFNFSNDTWLLAQHGDPYASVITRAATLPFTVRATVDNFIGTGYAGVFTAGAVVGGTRTFQALVINENGAAQSASGTMVEDATGLIVTQVTLSSLPSGDTGTEPSFLLISGYASGGNQLRLDYSTTAGTVLTSIIPLTSYGLAGVILFCTPDMPMETCTAEFHAVRNYASTAATVTTELSITPDSPSDTDSTLTAVGDKRVHLIAGASLADLDVDIRQTVPWASYFTNTVYITDTNQGATNRYWIIDYHNSNQTTVKYTSLPDVFFTVPVAWRQAQFAAASAEWAYNDNDWVLFLDAHEGLSFDTRSVPTDVKVNPFAAWIQREIANAGAATEVVLPFFVFVGQGPTTPQSRLIGDPVEVAAQVAGTGIDPVQANTSTFQTAVPYYHQPTSGGLVRLIKVSALRNPAFNWSSIDTLTTTPQPTVKVQIVSYGYARWVNPDTGVDEGMLMRAKLSAIRPIPGLPTSGSDTAVTIAGPYTYANGVSLVIDPGVGVSQPILTPTYKTLFRPSARVGLAFAQTAVGTGESQTVPRRALATAGAGSGAANNSTVT